MAGLVPAIHVFLRGTKNVDAQDKPGHDDLLCLPHAGFSEASAFSRSERTRAASPDFTTAGSR
ncbi:hypothetical protein ACVWYQ_005671 [Bradyrhizobium sp. USDA 3397]